MGIKKLTPFKVPLPKTLIQIQPTPGCWIAPCDVHGKLGRSPKKIIHRYCYFNKRNQYPGSWLGKAKPEPK